MSVEKYQSSTGSVFESKMVDAKIFKSAIRSLKSTAPGARESCAFIIENSKSTLFTTHCIENWLVFDTKKNQWVTSFDCSVCKKVTFLQ